MREDVEVGRQRVGRHAEPTRDLAGRQPVAPGLDQHAEHGEARVVRGTFDFSGKRFEITRGIIRFVGNSPPDPLLDIRAEAFEGGVRLERRHAREDLGNMEMLELSEGDGVGALEVCDDIERKKAFKAPQLSQLLDALRDLPEERPSSQAAREVQGIYGTSLGRERPKLTVEHQGQLWIAKLQDRGDGPNNPLREYVAMTLARECGVNAAEVQFHLEGHRQVVLVKRFDRDVLPDGAVQRHLYASAHTLLRLDKEAAGARHRSTLRGPAAGCRPT